MTDNIKSPIWLSDVPALKQEFRKHALKTFSNIDEEYEHFAKIDISIATSLNAPPKLGSPR